MKHLVIYNTTTGEILATRSKDVDGSVVKSGTGLLLPDEESGITVLGDSGFTGVVQADDFCDVTIDGGTKRTKVVEVSLDTALVLDRVLPGISAPYEIVRHGAPAKYSDGEKTDLLDEVEAAVGHSNIAAVKADAAFVIHPGEYFVDISDGNKVKHRSSQITYE